MKMYIKKLLHRDASIIGLESNRSPLNCNRIVRFQKIPTPREMAQTMVVQVTSCKVCAGVNTAGLGWVFYF